MEIQGKLAVVTGGSSGIGRAVATKLTEAGADVVICARSEDEVIRAAREIADAHRANCLGLLCDVANREEVKQMLDTATEMGSNPINVLVNNAGIARFADIRELDGETWDAVIGTNLTGPFNVLSAALPHLEKEGGAVFNIASIAAVHPFATGAAYNASKAGLHAFTQAVMQDLRPDGIRVCSILPGSVNTRLEDPAGRKKEPWKLEPEDIAEVILDLLRLPTRALPSMVEVRPTKTASMM
jgi:3-oxoacyl-[acyl-carrier protein] reductase